MQAVADVRVSPVPGQLNRVLPRGERPAVVRGQPHTLWPGLAECVGRDDYLALVEVLLQPHIEHPVRVLAEGRAVSRVVVPGVGDAMDVGRAHIHRAPFDRGRSVTSPAMTSGSSGI